jgi:hypothetical protein
MNNGADVLEMKFKLAKLDTPVKIGGRPMSEIDVPYLKSECGIVAEIIPKSVGILIVSEEQTKNRDGSVDIVFKKYFVPYTKVRSLEL